MMIQFIKYSVFVTILMMTDHAFATGANLGAVTDSIEGNLSPVPTLFSSVAYIMGIGFTIAGLIKMKEFVDDPGRSFMKDALIRLGVGALLILLPYAINVSTNTMSDDTSGVVEAQDLTVFN